MNFNEYQAAARTTAIYDVEYQIIYPALGLAGETGEVCEKVKKLVRDYNFKLTPEYKEQIKKEMGDVLWYLSNLAMDLGIDLGEVAYDNIKKLKDRQKRGAISGEGDNR